MMTRIELWFTGSLVKPKEKIKCSIGRCHCRKIREFDCGFFCMKHFIEAPQCSVEGCCNPAIVDPRMDSAGKCRIHEFDYDPEPEIYGYSGIAEMEQFGQGRIAKYDLDKALDKTMEKHGIPKRTARNMWFTRFVSRDE